MTKRKHNFEAETDYFIRNDRRLLRSQFQIDVNNDDSVLRGIFMKFYSSLIIYHMNQTETYLYLLSSEL